MAQIIGTVTSWSSKYVYWIEWSESNVNSTNNTSDVTASVWVKRTSTNTAYQTSNPHSLWIDGTEYTDNRVIDLTGAINTPVLVVSARTKTITHTSDGSKAITISSSGTLPYGSGYGPNSGSASGTATLTTITRNCTVTTTAASSVGGTSATTGGNVTDAGLPPCSSRGVFWGTTSGSQPNFVSSGSGSGAFSANITGLSRGTTYYFKAGAYNTSGGWKYGSVLNFTTTSAAPSVTTGSASSIATTTATVSGTVTNENGASVTTRGICYNTTGAPTTSSDKVASGTGSGAFSSNLTGLTPDTKYYARAYATNSVGTSYGVQIEFDTLIAIPSVTTTAGATGITTSVATVAGNVTSDNGATITERGFVYSLSENPTIVDSKAITTGTTGAMSKEITGLSIGTTYNFRAYATNSAGTGYGTNSTFTTLPGDPSNLVASTSGKNSVSLSWSKGNGGNYTIIRRGESAPANINSGDLVYQGTGTSTTDSGLDSGTTYYYRAWSATTSDWSLSYSANYTAANATTIFDFSDTANALVDNTDYATVPANDSKLYCQVSRDGGSTWSIMKELTFTTVSTQNFGDGTTELWGMMTWNGGHLSDANFQVKIIGGSEGKSYQIFKDFGFSISSDQLLTGVQVQAKAAWDNVDMLLYFIKVDAYYGDSPLPIGTGSLAYDTTKKRPVTYNGEEWDDGGSRVTVSETEPDDPIFGDIWVDVSSD